eukprot:CAMPEP_0171383520 /NCGR_PEP_ID=MMETSP0879-20121228/36646_2 /TAXON_ID=67004 /ORGANISM="Thalassiosira weissflogii, Strain CCMP1336" /LENGTH=41 /DNA_ID= /DNA_START= /DNA_END= /DNA_ORIENTATION=
MTKVGTRTNAGFAALNSCKFSQGALCGSAVRARREKERAAS